MDSVICLFHTITDTAITSAIHWIFLYGQIKLKYMTSLFFHFQSLSLLIYLQLNQKRGRNEQWPVEYFTFNIYLNNYYYIVFVFIFK